MAGVLGFVLQQVSLGTGRLAPSVATVSVANPVVGILIGILLLDERLSRPAWHVVLAVVGLGLALVGAVAISLAHEAAKDPAVLPTRGCRSRPPRSNAGPARSLGRSRRNAGRDGGRDIIPSGRCLLDGWIPAPVRVVAPCGGGHVPTVRRGEAIERGAAHMRRFPVQLFQGILPLDRSRIPVDVLGGVTLAALAIPETMGYTKIAGMPVITGLYTILLPIAVFAIFGSSRHLVVGADSATAAILAAGLAGMAASGSEEYVALAGLVGLLAALYLIVARLVHLGFLADFLSRTVLVGFLTGVGIQVAAGQVGGMFGVPEGTGGTLRKLWGTLQNLG